MSSTENTLADPFAALRGRLGITDDARTELAAEPKSEGEPFITHAEFERQRYEDASDCSGMLRVVEETGTLWIVVCDECGFEVGVQMQHADPERLLERQLSRAMIPAMFAGKEFEKGDPEQEPTLRACRQWVTALKPGHLPGSLPAIAVWGKCGRGKSHLLSLMVETVIRKHGVDAVYRSAGELFDELRAALSTPAYEIKWQRVLRVPVLALDDLAAGRWTEWSQDRFAALVDHRYSKQLPLLVATNIPPGGWDKTFGERTASRLKGMCLRFELGGADRRDAAQRSLLEDAA